jgi:hypothetical protein
MTVPFNTTCDIYHTGTAPPSAPALAGVPCALRGDWRAGQEHGDRPGLAGGLAWTHVLLVAADLDLRDAYAGGLTFMEHDSVYVPDKDGTCFKVIFVERVAGGTGSDHKRAYLDRQLPNWPTNHL